MPATTEPLRTSPARRELKRPSRPTIWATRTAAAVAGLLGAALVIGGCASMKPTESGFLSSYAGMVNGASDNVRLAGPAPDALSGIESVFVERPVWLATAGDGAGFEESQRDSVLTALQEALKDELGKLKPISDGQGRPSLVVRAAVTKAARSNPAVNVATSLLIGPLTNGGATIELEAIGPDGERVAAMVFADTGGVFDFLDAFTESGHARLVTRRAAAEFRDLLAPANTARSEPK